MSARDFTLSDVAEHLGVHYMTAYRYVRTGRLAARQQGSQWLVQERELEHFKKVGNVGTSSGRGPDPRTRRSSVERLSARLIAGDEAGSWAIAQEFQVSGAAPKQVYLELFGPALRSIGERWANGQLGVADEHRATVVMYRLIGRMGPQFRPRGPHIGSVIVGAPAGERHGLPIALAADLLRAGGFNVVDLGADVPADAFATCARSIHDLAAVVISVTAPQHRASAASVVRLLHEEGLSVPIVIGGTALSEKEALEVGGDWWVPDLDTLVSTLRAN